MGKKKKKKNINKEEIQESITKEIEKKEETTIIDEKETKEDKHKINVEKHKENIVKSNSNITKILSILTLFISLAFMSYSFIKVDNIMTNINLLSIPIMFVLISIYTFISSLKSNNKSYGILSIMLIIFISFYFSISSGLLILPDEDKLNNYNNTSYTVFKEFSESNNIPIEIEYEYSDTIKEGNIIRLSVNEGTYIKDIEKITVTISNGPDYDKLVIITSLVGQNIDDAVKYLNENFLNNIVVNYEISDEDEDTIIYQSINGEIRRNQELVLNVSIKDDPVKDIEMINLKDKTEFDALLWLKRNGINYEINYEFSDNTKKGTVLNQDKEDKTTINNKNDIVTLTISNGPAIKIPDFTEMTTKEATDFIIENNLKVNFEDIYSENIESGKIISQSINKDELVKEKTLITIVISKGQIKMEEFDNINDFRTWANKYNISYTEDYEYSSSIIKGNVISYSYNVGEVVDPNGTIVVKISLGKAINIPSFTGKTKSEAQSICNDLGLRCSFYTGNYSNTYSKDVVYSQSRGVNSTATEGASISLTLSKGKPTTYNLAILQNWLSIGNADKTIESLKSSFASYYPGVNFTFKKVSDNTLNSGMISGSSPTKVGASITQGYTYEIWVVSN